MRTIFLVLLFFITVNVGISQSDYLKFRTYQPYTWMVGGGWSLIDNDGRSHANFFDFKGAWLMHPYPTHLLVDRYLKHGFSLEFSASFNQFRANKMVNGAYHSGMMLSGDLTARYSFYKFLQNTKWLDPYLGIGVGVTHLNAGTSALYPTMNGVVGVNFWIKNFGIRLQGTAKFGLTSNFYYNDANYLHYTGALLYRFPKKYKTKSNFHKPNHKWTREKPGKYKGRSK